MGQEGQNAAGWWKKIRIQRDGTGESGCSGMVQKGWDGGTGQPHLLGLQQAHGHVPTTEDLPEGRPKAPLVRGKRQALGVPEALRGQPGDALHQHWEQGPCSAPTGEGLVSPAPALTVLGQDGDTDSRVIEFDEGEAASGHVPLPCQQHLLS